MFIVCNSKTDLYIRIKSLEPLFFKVFLCFKPHFINPRPEQGFFIQEVGYTSILVGRTDHDLPPANRDGIRRVLLEENDRHSCSGFAFRCI